MKVIDDSIESLLSDIHILNTFIVECKHTYSILRDGYESEGLPQDMYDYMMFLPYKCKKYEQLQKVKKDKLFNDYNIIAL